MELFTKKRKAPALETPSVEEKQVETSTNSIVSRDEQELHTFQSLGLCDWVLESVKSMGYRRPTDIQIACIPAILQGRDVMGCAETGSGKTAAFALPILQHLSADPFGIFAIILTPTRELAIQISEQVAAFGAAIGVRQALIIGGVEMTEQSKQLAKLPHIIIATPGRMRHHLEGSDPPNISRAQYIVLDEADRLLCAGFSTELKVILSRMKPTRKTLLFSATLTSSLEELETLAMTDTLRFDLTLQQKVPSRLRQEYLFMPAQVKLCYLLAVIRGILVTQNNKKNETKSK